MNPDERVLGEQVDRPIPPPADMCGKEDRLSLKRHKELNEASYRVKDFVDGLVGKMSNQEICLFGQMMQNIMQLR